MPRDAPIPARACQTRHAPLRLHFSFGIRYARHNPPRLPAPAVLSGCDASPLYLFSWLWRLPHRQIITACKVKFP